MGQFGKYVLLTLRIYTRFNVLYKMPLFLLTLSLKIMFRNQKIFLVNICCIDSTATVVS
jgi:hypothetical protein